MTKLAHEKQRISRRKSTIIVGTLDVSIYKGNPISDSVWNHFDTFSHRLLIGEREEFRSGELHSLARIFFSPFLARILPVVGFFSAKILGDCTPPPPPQRLVRICPYSACRPSIIFDSQKGALTIQRCSVENQKAALTIQRCSVENQKAALTIQRSSVENQKAALTIQRCSFENQKGALTIQRSSVENQKGALTIQRCSFEN